MSQRRDAEFVGCVMTCLSGGGIQDSRTIVMCLGGCYASAYLVRGENEGGTDNEDEDGSQT